MSTSITIDGKEYTPAPSAGKHFGYSKDYLLLLMKNGKIDGQKVGNRWYVNLPSAETFFTTSQREQEERRKRMSVERKLELQERNTTHGETYKRTALLETLVIVIIGLSVGATGYLGTTTNVGSVAESDHSFFEKLAVSIYTFISGKSEIKVAQDNDTKDKVSITDGSVPVDQNTRVSPSNSGVVVAPVVDFPAETIDTVRDSFSDEVEVTVDPEDPDTGIVVPKFKESEGEEYRFLMVPINQNTGS